MDIIETPEKGPPSIVESPEFSGYCDKLKASLPPECKLGEHNLEGIADYLFKAGVGIGVGAALVGSLVSGGAGVLALPAVTGGVGYVFGKLLEGEVNVLLGISELIEKKGIPLLRAAAGPYADLLVSRHS